MKQQYTLDEIKEAFWEAFHETGECFFCYTHGEIESNEHTLYYFRILVESLTGLDWKDTCKLVEKYKK